MPVRLQRIEADIAELKVDIAELKVDVAELKVDVAELKVDVAELKTDVAELKTDVAELKTDVGDLKGFALETLLHRRIRPLISQRARNAIAPSDPATDQPTLGVEADSGDAKPGAGARARPD